MKRTLLFVLALAVIPVGVDAQSPTADFWRARAEDGDAFSQDFLGDIYKDGDGVPQDYAEAVRWFRLAAEQGYASGQKALAAKYVLGEGVPVDYVLSYMWFNLAAAQGGSDAQRTKDIINDILAPRMTREQIAEAQRLSTEWLDAHPPGGN